MERVKAIYKDPEAPASFAGVNALHHAAEGNVSKGEIAKWLQGKESYTLHRSARRRFKRNRVLVGRIDQQWQADIADLSWLAKQNDGNRYLLTCIDIFSKFAWAVPLKDKSARSIVNAFQNIFENRKPVILQTDKGTEFQNKMFQDLLKKNKVRFFTTNNDLKASVVERFNRTIKSRMTRYLTEFNTRRYVDVIQKLVQSYNRTKHSSIKLEPVKVTPENQKAVWNTLYSGLKSDRSTPRFKVGDTVRIAREKMIFEKGYEHNWSREIFTVNEVLQRHEPVYRLKDLNGEVIEGTFYEKEIQKVTDNGYYPVEKVLKTRQRMGRKEHFVKFLGYPDKFNAWVFDMTKI